MTPVEDLELQLKGLVLVRAILDYRGLSDADLQKHSEEIRRIRARLEAIHGAEGGGAHCVAA